MSLNWVANLNSVPSVVSEAAPLAIASNQMAHSQKTIRDHARNRSHSNVNNEVISQQLEDLVKPCVYNQLTYYCSLGTTTY